MTNPYSCFREKWSGHPSRNDWTHHDGRIGAVISATDWSLRAPSSWWQKRKKTSSHLPRSSCLWPSNDEPLVGEMKNHVTRMMFTPVTPTCDKEARDIRSVCTCYSLPAELSLIQSTNRSMGPICDSLSLLARARTHTHSNVHAEERDYFYSYVLSVIFNYLWGFSRYYRLQFAKTEWERESSRWKFLLDNKMKQRFLLNSFCQEFWHVR